MLSQSCLTLGPQGDMLSVSVTSLHINHPPRTTSQRLIWGPACEALSQGLGTPAWHSGHLGTPPSTPFDKTTGFPYLACWFQAQHRVDHGADSRGHDAPHMQYGERLDLRNVLTLGGPRKALNIPSVPIETHWQLGTGQDFDC